MASLPTGAVHIGQQCAFPVAHSNANVEVKAILAITNSGSADVAVGVYVVLDGNTSAMQDSYAVIASPVAANRQDISSLILGLSAGDHTIDLYALTAGSCNMLFTGIEVTIFYA